MGGGGWVCEWVWAGFRDVDGAESEGGAQREDPDLATDLLSPGAALDLRVPAPRWS
ncbi:hypothetical protein GCM10022295_50460 [Streptomyces osmaniensis]|uniref:Uncharacterized protein n=1 Tax=Streptomyces osmaniensis TaxID=593134 RepID=A0ABP6X8P4_9ACTN